MKTSELTGNKYKPFKILVGDDLNLCLEDRREGELQ